LANTGVDFRLQVIKTSGDEDKGASPLKEKWGGGREVENDAPPEMPRKAQYTDAIDEALLEGIIDLAVHSLKDLAVELPKGLVIGSVPKREDPRDVLISRNGLKLGELPKSSRIGTSSPRRKAQLLAYRQDFDVVEIHGNVGTRLKKLWDKSERLDAVVLAYAGVKRLNLSEHVTQVIPVDIMIPAIGQGALALEARTDDTRVLEMIRRILDKATWVSVQAERAFSKKLGGGCHLPIAAYARVNQKHGRIKKAHGKESSLHSLLEISGVIVSEDGKKVVRDHAKGEASDPERVGNLLAESLMKRKEAEKILHGMGVAA
jgi:hydroxymethylbilane synthase